MKAWRRAWTLSTPAALSIRPISSEQARKGHELELEVREHAGRVVAVVGLAAHHADQPHGRVQLVLRHAAHLERLVVVVPRAAALKARLGAQVDPRVVT